LGVIKNTEVHTH